MYAIKPTWSRVLASGAIWAVATFDVVLAQSPTPRFEVVSIKPSVQEGRGIGGVRTFPGGRLTAQATVLRTIIQFAYRVKPDQVLRPFQIVGGPDWINSARFDIEAKAETGTSSDQLWLMLESLLDDKFNLKVHSETRQLPVYDLVPAKSGIKLPTSREGGCIPPDPNNPVPAPRVEGKPYVPPCGNLIMSAGQSGATLDGGNVPISGLTRILSNILGRSVIDKTELTGTFDVHMTFTPDDALEGLPAATGRNGERISLGEDPANGSIFTAIQQQLGLRLESSKGPVDVIVIDHVDHFKEN